MESLQAEVAPFGSVGSGGTFGGVRVVPSPAAGSLVVALDAAGIVYSDGGGSVDTSDEATIELSDAPTDPPSAATVYTSLWQTNHVGFSSSGCCGGSGSRRMPCRR